MAELVSVGVPVYRGGEYIHAALESIRQQTHKELDVLISIDGPSDDDLKACRPFLADSRFRLVIQDQRLGWVGNISYLMSQSVGDFWYYHQQDDIIDPAYVAILLQAARTNPQAGVLFCDIDAFGYYTARVTQTSVLGSPFTRQIALLNEHLSAVAFRGLTRAAALAEAGGVKPNEADGFAADTSWLAAVARWGELHRLPELLYRKRYHPANAHGQWAKWDVKRRTFAWCVHCRQMGLEALRADMTLHERRLVWLASIARLFSPRTAGTYLNKISSGDDLTERFETYLSVCKPFREEFERHVDYEWNEAVSMARQLICKLG